MTGRAGDVTAAAIAQAAAHLLAQSKQPIVAAVAQATGIAGRPERKRALLTDPWVP
jgi:hypothetical protein